MKLQVVDAFNRPFEEMEVPPLRPGERRRVSMEVETSRSSLTIRVSNERGEPVPGATVRVGSRSAGTTSEDGMLVIPGLARGLVAVNVFKEGYERRVFEATVSKPKESAQFLLLLKR